MILRDAATNRAGTVLDDGEVLTRAITESEMEHESARESASFSWTSQYAATGSAVEIMSIQNDHPTKDIVVEEILLAAEEATVFTVGNITSGTPAGTTLTPICLNREAPKTAQATSFGNANVTGTVVVAAMFSIPVLALNPPVVVQTKGAVLLGNGDQFGISSGSSAIVHCTVLGYFVDPSQL